MGLTDPSATPLTSLTFDVLNPLERQRVREAIRRYGGDTSLLPLADDELDGALGLSTTMDGVRRPTLAGLLLLGREDDLRVHAPAYEVAFQVLEGTDVRVNEFSRKPLLQTFEDVERLFAARMVEKEFQVGLFRVPVPCRCPRRRPREDLHPERQELYRKAGQKAGYVRQTGFNPIQQEQMVLSYIKKHGRIKRAEVMELCRITKDQAYQLLRQLKEQGKIKQMGERKGATYERKR